MASSKLQVNASVLFNRRQGNRQVIALGLITAVTAVSVAVLEFVSDDEEPPGAVPLYWGMPCVVFAES